ncbi:MAG: molybdopterin-guanine dinucleotide biosynthesis protein B [Desulfobacterales bacterium]|nr:molybdopterin-guanine dinucleotide biosynthesis protein B [Desulfobacterales bacterium]
MAKKTALRDEGLRCIESKPVCEHPPMVGIAGFSGSGKTSVTVGLVAEFNCRGLRVATIKHDVHGFEMDRPGKDSWRHKQAGAAATIVTSPTKIGMVMDADRDHQPWELLPLLTGMDLVLVEGFKRAPIPKIEVYRPETGKPPACRHDPNLIAVVSDAPLDWGVPRFASRDFPAIADFIEARFALAGSVAAICGQGGL